MSIKKVYVVVGGNRSLGLELVAQLLAAGNAVFATARAPEKAADLQKLQQKYEDLSILQLDASSDASIKEAASAVGRKHPEGIDTLLFNSGTQSPWTPAIETPPEDFRDVLQVNTIAPFVAIQAFYPLLLKKQTRTIVCISSVVGSIATHRDSMFADGRKNAQQGYLPYATSKAALNMITAELAYQLQPEGFIVVSLHPGHVDTSMGSRDKHIIGEAALTIEESAKGQMKVILGLKKEDTGRFLSWEGENIPY